VLAVIQHEQDVSWLQIRNEHIGNRSVGTGADAKDIGYRLWNQRSVGQGSEADQPHATGKALHFMTANLESQPWSCHNRQHRSASTAAHAALEGVAGRFRDQRRDRSAAWLGSED
jgi:hypothetical protein